MEKQRPRILGLGSALLLGTAVVTISPMVAPTATSLHAQVIGGGPGGPPPGGGGGGGGGGTATDTSGSGGSRFHWGTGAYVQAGACLLGNVLLYEGKASSYDYALWNGGCAALGPLGGAAALALFSEDGLITNIVTDGFKCKLPDDRRERCAILVQQYKEEFALKRHVYRLKRGVAHIKLPRPRPS